MQPVTATVAATVAASGVLKKSEALRVRFQPLMPAPVERPTLGVGEVILFSGAGVADRSVADAALACLLRASDAGGKRLLVEAEADGAELPGGLKLPTQVAGGAVWRTAVGGRSWRRRHWVLFLHECRQGYNTTFVVIRRQVEPIAPPPAELADRAIAVTRGDDHAMADARRLLLSWRRSGVAHAECLWLDAA